MDTTSRWRALALTLALVAAAAGTGWALQLPLTALADLGAAELPRLNSPAEVPAPGLSILAWPQPAAEPNASASVRPQAEVSGEMIGLEEMSATGAASPQR